MQWHLNIKSETKNIDVVRGFLRDIFCECGFDLVQFNRVFLAVNEAVCNSIKHGNQRISEKNVQIVVNIIGDLIVISVKDEGSGFEWNVLPDPTMEANIKNESGRGIYILRSIADEVNFQEGGTKVTIKFSLK